MQESAPARRSVPVQQRRQVLAAAIGALVGGPCGRPNAPVASRRSPGHKRLDGKDLPIKTKRARWPNLCSGRNDADRIRARCAPPKKNGHCANAKCPFFTRRPQATGYESITAA